MSKQPFDFRGRNVDQKFKYLKCGDIIARTNIYDLVIYLFLSKYDDKDLNYTHENKDLNYTHENKDLNYTHQNKNLHYTHENKDLNCTHENKDLNYTHQNKDLNYTHEYKQVAIQVVLNCTGCDNG